MEKPREIPGVAPAKNNATREQVAEVAARIDAIGVSWADACEAAGVARATIFRLKAGKASIASLRKVEDWLVREEARSPKRSTSREAPLVEWRQLGEALAELDPEQFATMLDGLRDLVRAERQRQGAILKMFRPTPDRSR